MMLTPKQKQSCDNVMNVYLYFMESLAGRHFSDSDLRSKTAVKLTQVYFDNHYHDGIPK